MKVTQAQGESLDATACGHYPGSRSGVRGNGLGHSLADSVPTMLPMLIEHIE